MDDFPSLTTLPYHDLRDEIQSGDLLLCSGHSIFSNLIKKATKSVWSHVAFILKLDAIDRIMVLESVESFGVRTIPLSNYVRDYNGTAKGYPGRIMIARHDDVKPASISKLSNKAIDFLGFPYRLEEIVHIAIRISRHEIGLSDSGPDQGAPRAFICSEYAQICFRSIDIEIDYNSMGFITPADFYRHPKVKPLTYLAIENLPQPHQIQAHPKLHMQG